MRGSRRVDGAPAGDKAPARRAMAHSEEEDRVVYRDLAERAGAPNLLFSPEPRRRPAKAPGGGGSTAAAGVLARPKGIFQQDPLFHLDGSGDEGDGGGDSEDENPFASLLQAPSTQRTESPPIFTRDGDAFSSVDTDAGLRSIESAGFQTHLKRASLADASSSSLRERSEDRLVSVKQQQKAPKRLSYESADSRPARWGARTAKPSAKDVQNRRKSLNAIHQRRLDKTDTNSSRRRSVISTLQSGVSSSSQTAPSFVAKRPRLSEVLHRATMLSQHKTDESPAAHSQPGSLGSPTENDAILDTEQQMKAEPFSPRIFSPARPDEGLAGRKQKQSNAALSKLRGDIGEVVRKAVRRTNRDLTLLRSDGQSLLMSHGGSSVSAVERIQERGHVIVRLHSSARSSLGLFACSIESATPDVMESCPDRTESVQVMLTPQTIDFVKATPGVVLRIYAPFHFVPRRVPTGASSASKRWFLIGTQLVEAVERGYMGSQ